MTSPAPEPPSDLRRPFLYADGIAAGLTPDHFRSLRWRRIFKGVYVSARVLPTVCVRAQAALLLHPAAAYASHTTAAHLLGIPVPDDPDIHVTVDDQLDRHGQPGLRAHVREAPSRTTQRAGVRVSHPLQLFVELAGSLSLVDTVVAGDAMCRLGLVTARELVDHCVGLRGRHSRMARRAVRYVRSEVDSPMETRLRMLLILAGLPEPMINLKFRDDAGNIVRRSDLAYEQERVIVEYDGRQHVEVRRQWEGDVTRRDDFEADGWWSVIVTTQGIYGNPGLTVQRVRRALKARGRHLPCVNENYRAHFPGR